MERQNTRYKDLEQFLTILVVAMLALFVFYLMMAAGGKTVLQIIAAVMIASIAAFGLWLLVKSRELLRQRSIWMTLGAACIILCILVSLVLNFPAPAVVLT